MSPRAPAAAPSSCQDDRVLAALAKLTRDQPVAVAVRGSSMAPRLPDGARVEIAHARRYWPGDVVAFANPQGRLVLHRLLGYRLHGGKIACVIRGDGCATLDPPLPPASLLGRSVERPLMVERLRALGAFLGLALRALRRRRPLRLFRLPRRMRLPHTARGAAPRRRPRG